MNNRESEGAVWRVGRALLRTVAAYGLLVCGYICLNSLTHPYTIALPLTHFVPWPTEGDAAMIGFGASALAFLILRLLEPGGKDPGCRAR